MLILAFFITNSTFGNSVHERENPDTPDNYRGVVSGLCDSVMANFADYDVALGFAREANSIAVRRMCEGCVAESGFILGVVFYEYSLYDSALHHFEKSLDYFSKKNDTARIVETIGYISTILIENYEYGESIKYSLKGLEYVDSAGSGDIEAGFYSRLGYCYEELGLYKKSIDALMSALEIFETENDSAGISSALINLGLVLANNNNFTDAHEYTSRALEISTKINDKYSISACLNNLGDIYSSTKEYENALEHFFRSLELDMELEDTNGIAICLNNIGDSYRDLKDTVLAISYYLKCLKIGKPHNYPVVAITLSNLGDIYLSQGDLKSALDHALGSLEANKTTDAAKQMLDSYDLLQNIYAAMGNYEKAHYYLKLHENLYDSIYSIAKSKHIQEIKFKYNYEKQKTEISNLKKRSSDELVLNTYLLRAIGLISLLTMVMFIIIVIIRRSRKLVRNQKQYYEKLLERSEGFIFVIDKDVRTKYISPAYERKIGRKIKNRIGKNAFEFIHPDDIEVVRQELGKLLIDKQPRSIDFRMTNAFDEWICVHAFGQNLLDDGLINGVVVNFWDITQLRKDEEIISRSEKKFRRIFNAFPDIYFQADMNGKITEISPSVTKITGYSRDEILGVSSGGYYNFIARWKKIIAKFETELFVHDFDTKVVAKDGSIIDCSLSAELIFSDDKNIPVGIKGVVRDISDRIKSQQKLRDSEFKLKEANRSKEKLFSIIAHDLIGPIGTNKSIVDLIVGQVDELSHEEVVSLVTSLKPSLDSTYSLVENLLSWARIQQDRLKPNMENILLNKLIGGMMELLRGQAQRKSIALTVAGDEQITVRADKNQLDIALRNLVSNAIKFSNQGGEVLISLSSVDGKAEIRISDSGIGMNQEQIDDILAGKGNIEARRGTDNEKGTGYGLIIVNEFVKNNGGTLNAFSKEGEGTTFIVAFPLRT